MKTIIAAAFLVALNIIAMSAQDARPVPVRSVPEPMTLSLLAAGVAGVGYTAWRQKRRQK